MAFRRSMAFLMMSKADMDWMSPYVRPCLWQSHSKVRVRSSYETTSSYQSIEPLNEELLTMNESKPR